MSAECEQHTSGFIEIGTDEKEAMGKRDELIIAQNTHIQS